MPTGTTASDSGPVPIATALASPSPIPVTEWSCPCLNVRLSLASDQQQEGPQGDEPGRAWLATLASDNAITVQYPSLTSRENITLEGDDTIRTSGNFSNNVVCAKCLNCNTVVYAASKPAPLGPNRAVGFATATTSAESGRDSVPRHAKSPVRDPSANAPRLSERSISRSVEPLVRPLDRKVWILPDTLNPQQASAVSTSEAFSPAFNILVHRRTDPPSLDRNASDEPYSPTTEASRRDATPTRSTAAGTRQTSFSALPATGMTYALPPVPQHLITTPPQSPSIGSGAGGAPKTPLSSATTPVSVSVPASSGLLGTSGLFHPLATQLDLVAVEKLKDLRSKAEAEVFELVRQKRREMEMLEKRIKQEADVLLEVTRAPKTARKGLDSGITASMIGRALRNQQQPQSPTTGQRARGATIATSTATAQATGLGAALRNADRDSRLRSGTNASASAAGRRDSLHDLDSDLPPSAFERRPTYAAPVLNTSESGTVITSHVGSGTAGGAGTTSSTSMATSLGGLSASFAMRGRDLPPQLQDWSEKRRLRERYPQGDHSALPSAANSNVTSAANSNVDSGDETLLQRGLRLSHSQHHQQRTRESSVNTEDDAEMEQRGRARRPSNPRPSAASATPTEPASGRESEQGYVPPSVLQVREEATARGRSGRPISGAFNPPAALSASLLTKKPAIVSVDDGRNDDEDTPSVGGKLVSPQSVAEPSAQVTLRPRDPPPANTEPLKPATRASVTGIEATAGASGKNATSTPNGSVSAAASRGQPSRKASEKKVAFAEAEDRVDHEVVSDEYEEGDDEEGGDNSHSRPAPVVRSRAAPANLVDESADAVFEIDEEANVDDDDGDGDNAEIDRDADDLTGDDQHRIEMSQSEMRTGESGRLRGQGDDALPGIDDDDRAGGKTSGRVGRSGRSPLGGHGAHSGSLSDDFRSGCSDDDEDKVPPGFGAASFSALAASQSAMNDFASTYASARADDSGFDPASLRMDGRVVVPPPSADRDLGAETESFVVGSLRNSNRRLSVQLPSGIASAGSRDVAHADPAETGDQGRTGPPLVAGSSSGKHQRSSSRTRIANMSKEDADTEMRLAGLLAPNAPSHRSLWSPKDAKARRASKSKYRLNEEDDQKWDAWKRKTASAGDQGSSASPGSSGFSDVVTTQDGRSNPMAVAPPTQYIAAGSGIGPRPMRESTMIDPDYAGSMAALSSFDRNIAARNASSRAGLDIGKRTWGYGSFKDDTSGFETEPKTSLPYKEKMMVPSLRKALRRSMFETEQSRVKLETIPDAEDASTSAGAASQLDTRAPAAVSGASEATAIPTGNDPARKTAQSADRSTKGALPGSVITKGFAMPGAGAAPTATASGSAQSASVDPAKTTAGFAVLGSKSQSTVPASAAPPAISGVPPMLKDTAVSTSLPGSGTATPTSIGRRSPRPPYVPPPPPSSTKTILQPDPSQAPKALELFQVPADKSFRLYEEGEGEETDEGWLKVLQFLHRAERLKTNKRTGWLHHRVPDPESIADHMYRMALLTILCPAEGDVNLGKCMQLAVVHDLAEAEVGDLTPLDGVDKKEKMRREKEAIEYFVHDLLGSSPAGLRIEELWEEYEARETKESKLVKDLDRFELCLQAVEYEREHGINDLHGFFLGSLTHITHPRIRKWAQLLAKERQQLWNERGYDFEQRLPSDE
ncbi:hypothetical protein BCV70DRAFT_196844 [Testicularia cyperi]|uniref:5'-deoxynucleotidase n=1 Tax=Testicularia cyperi TaxID=1882483 RepID=A0A317XXT1_9BASI|nr:hypothetical protein BCV70DRAFT_196844 [Testicularia cyperi]